jgi:hypothetical protein
MSGLKVPLNTLVGGVVKKKAPTGVTVIYDFASQIASLLRNLK